ncbi:hypothetical protein SOVF_211800 [Spinacia oleracea]|uniref:Kunitz trypsin inhibitor 5-like n=1 Tax=Spinacia oleracea TaxID=3562 RepID=A0A9R0I5M8_SPIOL|nr:kunitz trypsin inhibitor 5-like [Spinacia oleracea]KNA03166.1 hypothetical protein SOVF_211800 [Spinacia oleracea]
MTHFILSTSIIFLFFSLSLHTTTAANPAVLDIDGHPLLSSSNYYILPVVRGRGGGLTVSPRNATELCPLNAAQDSREVEDGIPLELYPVNPNDRTVYVSTDLNLVFDAVPLCVPSGPSFIWQLTFDEATGRRYVGFGGQTGNPGIETVSNWFKIQKAGSGRFDYKIVFCPSVCNTCKVMCGDVGVFVEGDGRRLLGIREQPLLVRFKRA